MKSRQGEPQMSTPTDELHTAEAVAKFLKTTPAALNQMRYLGKGPKFIRLTGRQIRYRWSDVEDWLTKQTCTRSGEKRC